jgi:Cu/Ag efflux pump CusA
MMRSIVGTSLKARAIVLVAAAAIVFAGVRQIDRAPRDVLPEFTQPTVEVQTEALGLSAPEVEQLVTVPLEQDVLNGTPFLDKIRSQSVAGLSSIQLVFKEGTKLSRARQVVNERLTQAAGIPNVSKPPQMLQPLSSTSRVMLIGLSSKQLSLIDMGVLARWTIRPRLMGVHGVANVSIFGQRERQLQVQVDPKELAAEGVTLNEIISTTGNALWWSPLGRLEANAPGTGGFLEGPNQRLGIFHENPIKTPGDLAAVPLEPGGEGPASVPAPPGGGGGPAGAAEQKKLGDVAKVVDGHQPLIGDGIVGSGTGLLLVVQKLPDANAIDVTRGVEKALDELQPGMGGLKVDRELFRPASYVQRATANLMLALLIGAALLALLLFALFFDWRIAVISALTIVVSLLAAGLLLRLRGDTINLIVLAGLALAVVVLADDVISDTLNIRRRLGRRKETNGDVSATRVVLDSTVGTRRPLVYAAVIILLGLLPIVVLKGEVGAFLPPLAFSYAVAIIVSMIVALTLTPVLALLLLSHEPADRGEPPAVRWVHTAYDRVIPRLVRSSRGGLYGFAIFGVVVVAGAVALPFLHEGSGFIPPLRDTNILVQFNGPPGTSIAEMDRVTALVTAELRKVSGVRDVGAQVGRAVLADQVTGTESSQLWVTLKGSADYGKAVSSIRSVVNGYPGLESAVLTYPAERINEVLRTKTNDVTVRVFGPDTAVLRQKADEVRRAMSKVDGVSNARVELPKMEPTFQVEVDLTKAEKAAIKPGDVRRAAATLISGLNVGALFQDQKVFDVVVWGTPETRANVSTIRDLVIDTPPGGTVRLGDVANVRVSPVESVIYHEDVSRYLDVGASVNGRDVGAVAGDVRRQLRPISFPLEHHATVLNDYSKHRSAFLRFLEVSIAAAIGIFLLMQAAMGSWRLAMLAFVTVPAALSGGALAALIDDRTISLGVVGGFLVVFAVAVRQVLLTFERYRALSDTGTSRADVVLRATRERSVPIIVTTVGAVVVLLPFLVIGHTAGFEIVHPMVVVVLGGLATAAVVNLFVLPPLYGLFGPEPERHIELAMEDQTLEPAAANGQLDEIAASSDA